MPVRSFVSWLLAATLALAATFAAAPVAGQNEPSGLEKAAEEAFARDELQLAGGLYRQAAEQAAEKGEKARLLISAASVEHLAERREAALAAILDALRIDGDYRLRRELYDESFTALFYEAQRQLADERGAAAAEAMRQGALHLRDQQWDKARQAFERALAEKSDQPKAIYNLALAQLYLGNDEAALGGFQKLLSLDAAKAGTIGRELRAPTLTNLGLLYIRQKSFSEAESALDEAVKLDAASQAAWSNLGVARRNLGKKLAAADAFRRAAELAPADPGAMNNLALAYIDAEEWMSAVALLLAATKSHPESPSLWLNLGRSQQGLGNEQGAIDSFEAAIRTDPDNRGGWAAAAAIYLAGHHLETKNYAAVKQQAARALAFNPGLVNGWFYQGLAEKGLGDLEGARRSLEKARDLDPRMAEIHNSLGSIYFELGLFEQAEGAFELALHLKSELKDAKTNLEAARQARLRAALGIKSGGGGAAPPPALPSAPEIGLRFSKIDYRSLGLSGLMIETVYPGSAAARAGLLSGDLLLRLGGRDVVSETQLRELLGQLQGRTVNVDLLRANRPTVLRLVVP